MRKSVQRGILIVVVSMGLASLSASQVLPLAPQSLRAAETAGEDSAARDQAERSPGLQFWIGVGFGYGLASPVCTACGEEGVQGGTTGNVFLGLLFGGKLGIGAQASIWVDGAGLYETRDDKIYRTHFMAIACYYPWEDSPLFGKAGFGFSAYTAYNRYQPALLDPSGNELPSEVHGEGPGVLVGLGYDFQVAGEILLSPTLSYFYGNLGPLVVDNARTIGEQKPLNLLELNLALSFRSAK